MIYLLVQIETLLFVGVLAGDFINEKKVKNFKSNLKNTSYFIKVNFESVSKKGMGFLKY